MRNITIYESFYPPLQEVDIVGVERRLGIHLPSDYRSFLLTHNGGYPEPSVFTISRGVSGELGVVNRFYGIWKEKEYDLLSEVETFQGRMPANLLPIACDPGGNQICLSVSGSDRGKVYFWFHEEEADEGEPPTYDNVYFVANSFGELLDNLVESPEELEEP